MNHSGRSLTCHCRCHAKQEELSFAQVENKYELCKGDEKMLDDLQREER
jgi:hypothetical protein